MLLSLMPLIFFLYNFIYLFMVVLGLHCCSGFSLAAASGQYSLVVVCRLLTAAASLVAECWALGHGGFSSGSSQVLEHRINSCGPGA